MRKYCKIIDENTGLVQLGAGCPDGYYIQIGMKLRDVEQSEIDEQWYLKNKCPHYTEQEKFEMAKADKRREALNKAYYFINNIALYNDVECTDNNIGKFDAMARGFDKGYMETATWTTKSDVVITLTAEDVDDYLINFQLIQSDIWNVQYVHYLARIESAKTLEEVNNIVIDYEV